MLTEILRTEKLIFIKVGYKRVVFILGVIYRSPLSNFNSFLVDLKNSLINLNHDFSNYPITVGGDFNCRVSCLNQINEEIVYDSNFECKRNSLDSVCNSNGEWLVHIFESCGFLLLNGRSQSDLRGNFTLIN